VARTAGPCASSGPHTSRGRRQDQSSRVLIRSPPLFIPRIVAKRKGAGYTAPLAGPNNLSKDEPSGNLNVSFRIRGVAVRAVGNHTECGVGRVVIVVAQTRVIEDILPFQTQLKIPAPILAQNREALHNRDIRGPIAGIAEEPKVRGYSSAEGEVLGIPAVRESVAIESGRVTGGDVGTARESADRRPRVIRPFTFQIM